MSIMSDGLSPSNGGKWELMHYVDKFSSYLQPLDGVDPSDMIDIAFKRPCITLSLPKCLTFRRPFKKENAIGSYCTQETLMIHKKEGLLPFFANKALNKNRVDGRVQRMRLCVVIFKAVKSNTF